jgi:cytidylate kinase
VIAIDGPSAAGKSSTARAVARAVSFLHLDSGALYRGVTLGAIEDASNDKRDQPILDPVALVREVERRRLTMRVNGPKFSVYMDDRLADGPIRSHEVTRLVSEVAAMPEIRTWVTAHVRELAEDRSVVVDGRDIGTVVFPEAGLKIFLTASAATRAERRLIQRGEGMSAERLDQETEALVARDTADTARAVAPLTRPEDAIPLDGTRLSFEEQVEAIVAHARRVFGLAGREALTLPRRPIALRARSRNPY